MAAMDSDVTMANVGESSSAAAAASSSVAKKAKRFEIKKWNAVALWALVTQIPLNPNIGFLRISVFVLLFEISTHYDTL